MKNWFDELDDDAKRMVNMISGKLSLPMPQDYESMAHFLHDLYGRISEADSLVRQANRVLGGEHKTN